MQNEIYVTPEQHTWIVHRSHFQGASGQFGLASGQNGPQMRTNAYAGRGRAHGVSSHWGETGDEMRRYSVATDYETDSDREPEDDTGNIQGILRDTRAPYLPDSSPAGYTNPGYMPDTAGMSRANRMGPAPEASSSAYAEVTEDEK